MKKTVFDREMGRENSLLQRIHRAEYTQSTRGDVRAVRPDREAQARTPGLQTHGKMGEGQHGPPKDSEQGVVMIRPGFQELHPGALWQKVQVHGAEEGTFSFLYLHHNYSIL